MGSARNGRPTGRPRVERLGRACPRVAVHTRGLRLGEAGPTPAHHIHHTCIQLTHQDVLQSRASVPTGSSCLPRARRMLRDIHQSANLNGYRFLGKNRHSKAISGVRSVVKTCRKAAWSGETAVSRQVALRQCLTTWIKSQNRVHVPLLCEWAYDPRPLRSARRECATLFHALHLIVASAVPTVRMERVVHLYNAPRLYEPRPQSE